MFFIRSRMARRNPARIPLSARRHFCQTVDDMRRHGWDVISRCATCGLVMRVDLAALATLRGPTFSLWNRKPRCRRLGCTGHASFQARAPDMAWHDELQAEE